MSNQLNTLETIIVVIVGLLGAVALGAAISAISALVITWAWNAVIPAIFGLPHISFWQAFALMVLVNGLRQAVHVANKNRE